MTTTTLPAVIYVPVSTALLAELLAEWSDPVQVKVEPGDHDGTYQMTFKRVESQP